MIEDTDGTLKPFLRVGPDWSPDKLVAWCEAEISKFNVRTHLKPYKSRAGFELKEIQFIYNPYPDGAIAGMYFCDEGHWCIEHAGSEIGRQVTHYVYEQLLAQGIAVKLPDWIKSQLEKEGVNIELVYTAPNLPQVLPEQVVKPNEETQSKKAKPGPKQVSKDNLTPLNKKAIRAYDKWKKNQKTLSQEDAAEGEGLEYQQFKDQVKLLKDRGVIEG
jgi:hypothetical protein